MKKTTTLRALSLAALFLFAAGVLTDARGAARPGVPQARKLMVSGDYVVFDVNNISTFIRNNGSFNRNPGTGNSGFEWPKGTGNTANYASGLWLGGVRGGTTRVAVAEYTYEYDAGPVGADPGDPQYRVYKIRRGDGPGVTDWDEWPVADGAPVDGSGNPKLIGDMTVFAIYNEADPLSHVNMTTEPLGIEVQMTAFAFNRADALGNNIYYKWKLINRSGQPITDMYVTLWTDVDLGEATDDFDGCDTTLGLGYTYNADPDDGVYGAAVPATGFDFLQGPLVPGAPGDTARFPDGRIAPGMRFLKMTSFLKYSNDATDLGNPNTGPEVLNYMRGRTRSGLPITDNNGNPTTFMFPGDPTQPLSSTNWIEAGASGDRRFMMSAGPFTMAAGDTQEIVAANLIAVGADYLGSVVALKNADALVQTAYELNFGLAPPPLPPPVEARGLDQEVILFWGENDTLATSIEETSTLDPIAQAGGAVKFTYDFQGYVVYQLPSATADPSLWKIVKTYDLPGNVEPIYDDVFDPSLGFTVSKPVRFGENKGIQRSVRITRDLFTNAPLRNNRDYYFVVTAYTWNEESVPRTLESGSVSVTVRPSKSPGSRITSAYGDTVGTVTHVAGISEASIVPVVVNPAALTGHQYQISVDASGGSKIWKLRDLTSAQDLLTSPNFGPGQGGTGYSWPVKDGISWRVFDVESRPNQDSCALVADSAWMMGVRWEHAPAVIDPTGEDYRIITIGSDLPNYLGQFGPEFNEANITPLEVRFGPGEVQKAYRLRRVGGVGTAYVIQAVNPYVDVPFTVWDRSNPASPRQLTVTWRDQNNNALFDPVEEDDGLEIAFIYFRTYDPAGGQWPYEGQGSGPADWSNKATVGADADVMYGMSFGLVPGVIPWRAGSKLVVIPFKVLKSEDLYAVAAPAAPATSPELVQADLSLINAVPNPYFGANAYERNQFNRVMRFTNLPDEAKLRIFNLAGDLVRTIDKNDRTTTADWDLTNQNDLPVASGMYLVYIEMPGIGTKILKVAVIMSEERLDNF
ncbi:MAG: T9SS type A sorting domain-containing protein [Bacteroidota bacterium]